MGVPYSVSACLTMGYGSILGVSPTMTRNKPSVKAACGQESPWGQRSTCQCTGC